MGVGLLGVPEEGVRDPDLSYHVAVETQDLHGAVELQASVVPGLSEEDVDSVFLSRGGNGTSRALKVSVGFACRTRLHSIHY